MDVAWSLAQKDTTKYSQIQYEFASCGYAIKVRLLGKISNVPNVISA